MSIQENNAVAARDESAHRQEVLAGFTHLGAMLLALSTGWMAGAGGMLVGIGVWLFSRNRYPHLAGHAAEVFNFNLSLFIYLLFAIIFVVLTLGIGLIVAVPWILVFALVWVVASVMGAIAGFNGRSFRYPFTIRVLR